MSADADDNFDFSLMHLLDLEFDHDADGNKMPEGEDESGQEDEEAGNDDYELPRPPDHDPLERGR